MYSQILNLQHEYPYSSHLSSYDGFKIVLLTMCEMKYLVSSKSFKELVVDSHFIRHTRLAIILKLAQKLSCLRRPGQSQLAPAAGSIAYVKVYILTILK